MKGMCSNRKWKLPKIGYKQRYLVLGMEARCEVVSHTSEKSPFPQSKLMVYKTLSPLCSKPASPNLYSASDFEYYVA